MFIAEKVISQFLDDLFIYVPENSAQILIFKVYSPVPLKNTG